MTEIVAARAQIQEVARDLEGIQFRLLGVLAILPPTLAELDPVLDIDEIEQQEPQADLRGSLQCVLQDYLEPALGDLRRLASDGPEE